MLDLVTNEKSLRSIECSGSIIQQSLREYESGLHNDLEDDEEYDDGEISPMKHHEEGPAFQAMFRDHIVKLHGVFNDIGNPFLEKSKDLFNIWTKDLMDADLTEEMQGIEERGREQYQSFVTDVIQDRHKSPMDTISKIKCPSFAAEKKKKPQPKVKSDLRMAQHHVDLFSRMYLTSSISDMPPEEFFEHETQEPPPAFSKTTSTSKSKLLTCMSQYALPGLTEIPRSVTGLVYDGPMIPHFLVPEPDTTFKEYAVKKFVPYVLSRRVSRSDVVFDVYIKNSLKQLTRIGRGQTANPRLRKVTASTKVPRASEWAAFLQQVLKQHHCGIPKNDVIM